MCINKTNPYPKGNESSKLLVLMYECLTVFNIYIDKVSKLKISIKYAAQDLVNLRFLLIIKLVNTVLEA